LTKHIKSVLWRVAVRLSYWLCHFPAPTQPGINTPHSPSTDILHSPAYEDGTDSGSETSAIRNQDAGELPKKEQISLSDQINNSEHLPTADIANREPIHTWEGQLSSLINIAWQVHVFTSNITSSLSKYKLANARWPVYLLTFLVAKSEIWTTDPGPLQAGGA